MSSQLRLNTLPAAVLTVFLIGSATTLRATIVLPTLPPGTQYQLVFVTSDGHNALSSNISTYNDFVNQEASFNLDLPTTTWSAIASTPSVIARNNALTYSSLPIYNTHGQLVAHGTSDFYYPQHLAGMSFDQYGIFSDRQVWTGSNPSGTAANTLSEINVTMGETTQFATANWMFTYAAGRGNVLPLYALSAPITVVPEPSTFFLAGLGLLSLMAWRFQTIRRFLAAVRLTRAFRSKWVACITAIVALSIACKDVHAQVVPAGLAPGSTYYLTFITSDATDALHTDLAYYNDFVNQQAALSPLTSSTPNWQAMVNVSAGGASLGLDAQSPVYLLDGSTLVAQHAGGMFLLNPGTAQLLNHPIDMTQYGSTLQGDPLHVQDVWTGGDPFAPATSLSYSTVTGPNTYIDTVITVADLGHIGSRADYFGNTFDGITSETISYSFPSLGITPFFSGPENWQWYGDQINYPSTDVGSNFQDAQAMLSQKYPLYAISELLTVPSVPEPSTTALCLAACACAGPFAVVQWMRAIG